MTCGSLLVALGGLTVASLVKTRWSLLANEVHKIENAKALALEKEEMKAQLDDTRSREKLHYFHTRLLGLSLQNDIAACEEVFKEMKAMSAEQENHFRPWITKRIRVMEEDLGDRIAFLRNVLQALQRICEQNDTAKECLITYMGPHDERSDEGDFLRFSQQMANCQQQVISEIFLRYRQEDCGGRKRLRVAVLFTS